MNPLKLGDCLLANLFHEDGEMRKPNKVQVHINDSFQKDSYEFEGGDTEALIRFIDAHEMLMKDRELKDNIAYFSSLMAIKVAAENRNPILLTFYSKGCS